MLMWLGLVSCIPANEGRGVRGQINYGETISMLLYVLRLCDEYLELTVGVGQSQGEVS